MQVITKEFLKELEWTARFIGKKTTIPVLQNVLLDARDGELWMSGTDLETAGQTMAAISDWRDKGGSPFKVTIPVHSLLKYLKKVEEPRIELWPTFTRTTELIAPDEADSTVEGPHEERIVMVATGLIVRHGESEVTLEGITAAQFPDLPTSPFEGIELTGLSAGIPRATLAISAEESRFTLNGALLEINSGYAKLVATDGHRLSMVELGTDAHKAVQFKALIGGKVLTEVARISDRCIICRDEHHVFLTTGHRSIVGRVIAGNFPDYERVVPHPDAVKYAAQVESSKLQKALERVQVFADERSHCVRVKVSPGTMELSSCTSDNGKASSKVPANWIEFEGAYASSFNASYILDFVKAAKTDSVVFHFDDPTSAAQWSIGGWRYVTMPMRDGAGERPYAERDARLRMEARAEARAELEPMEVAA